ncbi:hypothetical protein ACFX15_034316 [Malus domestica]|uniref:SCP domain-containing protein n=1 Tax=Malus domestica TaxID=3750 RepID=A0A498JWI7_MALDO|nr:hypothetical protein DVH24_009876 [Malus domestica]
MSLTALFVNIILQSSGFRLPSNSFDVIIGFSHLVLVETNITGLWKTSFALVCLISITLLPSSHAQDSPQDYLNAHNAARAQVGVAPLSWDTNLANYAQRYANSRIGDCNLVHFGGPYNENIAKSTGDLSGTAAVNLFVSEKADYNYNSNTCAAGKV